MDKPYLIGRATAIVERLVDVPSDFVAMVQVNPLQKISYHLREALKNEDEELVEIVGLIGDMPARMDDVRGQFYIGYYHQKSELTKYDNRIRMGEKLAAIRNQKGLSIRELAEACGVTAQNITKIEHGRYNVSIDILGKICEALGCQIDIVKNMNEVVVTKEEMERIMEHLRGLTDKPAVVVDGNSLVEAMNERMKKIK